MIETVARALAACPRDASDKERARAAITAMRAPTTAMWKAGARCLPIESPAPLDAHHVFVAMIDEALKDG